MYVKIEHRKEHTTMNEGTKLLQALVHKLHNTINTVDDYSSKQDLLQKVANSGKLDPSDPDQVFYIRYISELGEIIAKIKMYVEYLDSPIKKEGKLRLAEGGGIFLGDEVFERGHIMEYEFNGQWELGTLQKSQEGYYIMDPRMKERLVQVDGLRVRVR